MRSERQTAGAGSNAKGSKREAVLKALRHEDVRPIPYYMDLIEEVNHKMQMHTGDQLFSSTAVLSGAEEKRVLHRYRRNIFS